MKRILVIDGNSIINRAYYGMRPLTTRDGRSTHAVYGMINIISRQMNALKPDYAAVAFDLKAPTFRHKMYDGYKAGRHPTPEDLLSQFPEAKECLSLMGLHILELAGYEADDIQGTVAKLAHTVEDTESYVLSGDRDLLQLIDDKVTVLLATNNDTKVMREGEFREEYGISPESFVDMKALMGDSSDNIPGVAGIGKKTAQTLIEQFGTLDGIYENIEDKRITKGVREKLLRDRDNAYLSKTLATIITDAPIGKTLAELATKEPDRAGMYLKFTDLELNSLITKLGLSAPERSGTKDEKPRDDATAQISIDAVGVMVNDTAESTVEYIEINAEKALKTLHAPLSIQLLNTLVYISDKSGNYRYTGALSDLKPLIEGQEILCHDGKALWHAFDASGLDLTKTRFLDLMLAAYVLNPTSGASTPESIVSIFADEATPQGGACVAFYRKAWENMAERVRADGLTYILEELELPLIGVLAEIEKCGFKINSDTLREYSDALGELAEDLTARIYMQAGREFNINSPKQLGVVLFEEMGLHCGKKKTKTGYSTDAETLEELRSESPIIDDILEYKQVTKLRNTYAAALPEVADENGRIHTSFKQARTETGRLSSTEPNLQNIPIRTKMGRELRRSFIAKDGYTLVDADYSQIELRLLAHISDDYTMKEAFIEGEDIHRKTAAAVFGLPEEMINDEMRKKAKAVNFGIVYGIGGFSLSKDLGISVSEASRYIKSYMMNYPSIERFQEEVVESAKTLGYTTTVFGRRRYVPELTAQNAAMRAAGKRIAMNAPIQGTAADIMKMAMINVHRRLKSDGLDAQIVMQVHDELVVECRDCDVERCMSAVREEMENVAKLSIPLTVDVTRGKNWLEQE